MKLTQIDIIKYKSIKNPISIFFNEGKVVTFIGKNGSGKTNILEAIKFAMSKNSNYRQEKIECKIKYHIELSDDEITEYFSCVKSDKTSKEIIVEFNGDKPELRLIEAPIISIEAESYKSRLDDILKNYTEATHKYLNALREIESSESYFGEYLDLQVKDENKGSIALLASYRVDLIKQNINNQINDIKNYIAQLFKGNKISLTQHERLSPYYYISDIPFYGVPEEEKIQISPIVAQSLNINKKALDQANEKLSNKLKEINNILKTEYGAIQKELSEYKNIKQEIANIFDTRIEERYEQEKQINNLLETIIQKLRKAVFRNCYYIDNENSLIFYNSPDYAYRNEQLRHDYLNSRNPIVDAFDTFLHERQIIDENISIAQKDKLDQDQIIKAIRALNSKFLRNLIPKFDNNEIKKFEVKYNNGFALYVHEKNRDIVSINNTSLGRRWYLTYQFVKALLQPSDMLLIDEPAAFLHPQAQAEFKNELETLALQGICVFYSTHSPYMIPEDWGQVYNIAMTDKGTQATTFETGDELCEAIKTELGAKTTSDILFNLSKTILLVEGIADKTCIEKLAELLKYDLSSYKILPCNGSPILDVTYLCINQGIKFKALFDLDNKTKPEYWMNSKYGYKEYLKIFESNENCAFTPQIRQQKSLEDCFHELDNEKYFSDHKWFDKHGKEHVDRKIDRDKVKQATEFENETKYNFEQLFIQLKIPKLDESKK